MYSDAANSISTSLSNTGIVGDSSNYTVPSDCEDYSSARRVNVGILSLMVVATVLLR